MFRRIFHFNFSIMKINLLVLPLSVFLITLFFSGCESDSADDILLATVDGKRITVNDYLREGQNIPVRRLLNIGASVRSYKRPQDILDLLIEIEIMVQEASEIGLDKTELYGKRRKYEIEKLSRWELYYREIDSVITISEEDTRLEFLRQNQQVMVSHIFSNKENGIKSIQSRLDAGEKFANIAKNTFSDTLLAFNGGNLGWIKWGEWDPYFEEAAWKLKPGDISGPIQSTFGWHIIKVEDRKQNMFITEEYYVLKISTLKDAVRKRKAEKYSNQYLNNLMREKNPRISKETFNLLAAFMAEVKSRNKTEFPQLFSSIDSELKVLSEEFAAKLDDIIVSWNGGELTVEDFLNDMKMNRSNEINIRGASSLNRAIWRWLRNKLLAEQSIKMGYHNSKRVTDEIKLWHQNQMMNDLIMSKIKAIQITEAEIADYYNKNKTKYLSEPMVNVREILVSDEDQAYKVLQKLENGVDFSFLAKQYSIRKGAMSNKGELGYFQSGQFKPLDKHAFSSKIGEIIGPIQIGSDFSIIEIIGKKGKLPIPLENVKNRIRGELLKQMEEEIYIKTVNVVRSKHKIVVDTELFRKAIIESGRWSDLNNKISNLFVVSK